MSLFDFVVVLIGYTLSGEPTLLAFYERLLPVHGAVWSRISCPIARPFPLSRHALDQPTVEAPRKLCARRSGCTQAVCLSRRNGGSNRTTMVGCGCGWNQGYCSPTCATADGVAARSSSSCAIRSAHRVSGAQARRSGAY